MVKPGVDAYTKNPNGWEIPQIAKRWQPTKTQLKEYYNQTKAIWVTGFYI